ncbi:MAG TPA: response regulator transcription factor [Caulobacteraceae bacterium]
MRILLVEDDPMLGPSLAARLEADGFVVDHVTCLADAVEAVMGARYRAVLLDRRLPDGEGMSLLPVLQTRRPMPPVLLVTALDDIPDRVAGLEAGAEDYLIKPFAYEELRARLYTRMRRSPEEAPSVPLVVGGLAYDLATREARVGDRPLTLPRREMAILDSLVRRAGRVVMREHLESDVYGYEDEIQSNALEAHVSRLRRRLADARAGVILHAVRGVGYMLRAS